MNYRKTITIVIAIVLFALVPWACKEKSTSEPKVEVEQSDITDADTDSFGSESVADCDAFLEQYEAWSKDYIAFLGKYKDNPIKAVTSPEYSEMMLQASSWSQDWLELSVSCAQNSSYNDRVNEISDRMQKMAEELGY
ncbi:hypothetical protein ABV409_12975 [Flagellimonas sp. DF-77]|uniref:hypothetical protein n=1 Tax=Flagellimonas algarum TaxID=3230298 RepID=UPI00339A0BD0